MSFGSRVLTLAATSWLLLAIDSRAASEIAIAIRYLQAEGTSHSHLYLYRDDGKFLRQLTNDSSGQDVDPIFSPDGATIVFTREKSTNSPLEFWSVQPLGADLKRDDRRTQNLQSSRRFSRIDLARGPERSRRSGRR